MSAVHDVAERIAAVRAAIRAGLDFEIARARLQAIRADAGPALYDAADALTSRRRRTDS